MLLAFEAAIKSGRGRELRAAPSLWHSEVAADSSSLIPAPHRLVMRGCEVPRSLSVGLFPLSFLQTAPIQRGEMRRGCRSLEGLFVPRVGLGWTPP